MSAFALTGARIFDGERLLEGHALVVEGGRIRALMRESRLEPVLPRQRIDGLLAPGFIDVQVNGGGGVMFNDQPRQDGIARIAAAHRRFGTTGFMVTLISDSRAKTEAAIAAVGEALAAGLPGLLGIHIEGPFLNVERRGVHDAGMIRVLEEEDLAILTSLPAGRTLVTLAPEKVAPESIRRLAEAGVIVSAGHTAADYATVRHALDQGLRGFTHLFNAMPPLASREPGPVGAALEDPASWCGLIADLHHVSAASLKIAIAAKGFEKTMLVTDAMATVGAEMTEIRFQGQRILRAGGCLKTEQGALAGSDIDMATSVRNTVNRLGLPLEQALAMASRVPAAFLRLEGELGRLAPGFRASLVLLDEHLQVRETWIDGARSGADFLPRPLQGAESRGEN
jgi:N-acetylglucosamine-6-phosphate deacetylase